MKKFTNSVNLPKIICSHVLGKQHSKYHRKWCGVCVMVVGVFCAEVLGVVCHDLGAFAHMGTFVCNVIGYGLHGAGLVPFIEIDE